MMTILDKSGILYQIILTKIDEIKKEEIEPKIEFIIDKYFKKHPALFKEILSCSSKENIGIEKIRNVIFNIIFSYYNK